MSKAKEIRGLIGHYNLQEWWNASFSEEEQEFIKRIFQPLGGETVEFTDEPSEELTLVMTEERTDELTEEEITYTSMHVTQFLSSLASWFIKKEHASIANRIRQKMNEEAKKHPRQDPGCYKGRHYTTYVEDVKHLKRSGQLDNAEQLLLELLKVIEVEGKIDKWSIPPWYYWELAIIYRKKKEYQKEIEILSRYLNQYSELEEIPDPNITIRLEKAKQLFSKRK